jgi:hypothetical protein
MYVHTKDVGFNDFYSVRLSVIEVVYGHISGDILYLIISVTGPVLLPENLRTCFEPSV